MVEPNGLIAQVFNRCLLIFDVYLALICDYCFVNVEIDGTTARDQKM